MTPTRHNLADAPRPGERANGRGMACIRNEFSEAWPTGADHGALASVMLAVQLSEISPALALALARAGALGAAARLAQH